MTFRVFPHANLKSADTEDTNGTPLVPISLSTPRNAALQLEDKLEKWKSASRSRVALEGAMEVVRANTGLLLVIAAQAFGSSMLSTVKILNNIDSHISTLELIFVRMVLTYLFGVSYMYMTGIPDPWLGPKEVRWLLAFRGCSGFFGLFGAYFAVQYLSLSEAIVLTFLIPLCTGLAGAVFLGETFSRKQLFAGVFSLAGVVLIARPPLLFGGDLPSMKLVPPGKISDEPLGSPSKGITSAQRLLAVGVSLIGVAGGTCAITSMRAIGKRAHPLHSMMAFSLFCTFITSITMTCNQTPFYIPPRLDWIVMFLLMSFLGIFSQVLMTMGMQRETAGRASLGMYTSVVFAMILELIFFHTIPPPLSLVGTAIIIGSALFVALSKTSEKDCKEGKVTLPQVEEGFLEEGLHSEGLTEQSLSL